jgi:PKD repeat protein
MVSNILKGVFLVLAIFLVSLTSAATVGNPSDSIQKNYAAGDEINGWINISLSNEPSTSLLQSSFGGNISLLDLLQKTSNSAFEYTCNPVSCTSGYLASNGATFKTFNLGENQSVLIGVNISKKGLLTDISSFTLHIASNSPETENLPLTVDILNDGQNEWTAYASSENFGAENYGCFIGTLGMSKANIADTPYCERIRLSKTPEAEIGAYVEEITPGTGTVNFDMTIEKTDGSESGECPASASESGRLSCVPLGFSVNEDGDYFVCIKAASSMDATKYKIAYEQNSPCGFSGDFAGIYDYDFEIFARPKMYAAETNFNLDNNGLIESGGPVTNVEQYLEDYIADTYNNNCSRDCIIPIKIFSGVNQQLNISNLSLTYFIKISDTTNKLYDLTPSPSKINSQGFQKLYLTDAGFAVPETHGNYTFFLSLNDEQLLSEDIAVAEMAGIKSLTPTKTAIKYPTKFTIILNDTNQNISKYNWDFGDGSSEITTKPEISHTYDTVGNYKLTVTIIDFKGRNSSKEFSITVGPASTIVPGLLVAAETNIAYVKSQIPAFSLFEQRALNYSLKLDDLEKDVTRLKNSISEASSEAQYENVLGELLGMKIPNAIAKTAYSEGIAFYPQGNNIDMDAVKKIGGGDYEVSKEEQYKEAVLAWEEANTQTTLVYGEISAIYEDYEEPLLKTFDISIKNNNGESYFIIKNMKNLFFSQDYSKKESGGYTYITLNQGTNNVVFSTTDNVDFITLPAFVSPAISQLMLAEWTPFTKEGGLKRWILFIIIVIGIIFVALAAWIFLQFWYKRKYENHLFKNRNNLYNLVNYIANEKKKGTGEKEIAMKLRKAGWNSEQIRYATRKYAGKSTGMPEIPVEKILKQKGKK